MKDAKLNEYVVKILGDNNVITGTGFFVNADGFILTCHHVIAPL
jgi:S1-C subfamily serine protease